MKLVRGDSANSFGSTELASGTDTTAPATVFMYQTLIAASPVPWTVTRPSSSTVATWSADGENLAHGVTSSVWPSAYQARTTTRSLSCGLTTAAGGNTSSRCNADASARGAGAPAAIQS